MGVLPQEPTGPGRNPRADLRGKGRRPHPRHGHGDGQERVQGRALSTRGRRGAKRSHAAKPKAKRTKKAAAEKPATASERSGGRLNRGRAYAARLHNGRGFVRALQPVAALLSHHERCSFTKWTLAPLRERHRVTMLSTDVGVILRPPQSSTANQFTGDGHGHARSGRSLQQHARADGRGAVEPRRARFRHLFPAACANASSS